VPVYYAQACLSCNNLAASGLEIIMEKLLAIMQELREKCPWDQQQTPESLTRYAIEEAYEVEDAIRSGDIDEIRNELGDLLLQVVFQSQMFDEKGLFNFQDVVNAISEKLVRRHPHVFEAEKYQNLTPEQVSELWKQIKLQEKQGKVQSRLDEVKHAPALVQAHEIQKKAAQLGFDFETVDDAYAKLDEELGELQHAIKHQSADEIEEEFGDCLFSLINVGRKLGVSSEASLLATIHKFRSRFAYIEQQAQQQHKDLQKMSLAEMDELWEQAKIQLKSGEGNHDFSTSEQQT
jgi:MazG family protein